MASLLVENLASPAPVPIRPGQSLLDALQAAGLDWAHACGGRGRCTTCQLRLTAGAEFLEPDTTAEARYRAAGQLPAGHRLTCQGRLTANVPPGAELRGVVPPEGRLPHVIYL
ncbi:MAG: (2Fe-2S)-binding protein [Hymenobacteraceae bacterium]|nr:(2Fe-2S)-binding protein [Hymenobacteraceae bacterium]